MGSPLDTTSDRVGVRERSRFALRVPGFVRGLAVPFGTRYAVTVGAIFACLAIVLVWNVAHYPAGESPDATDHFHYTDTIRHQHALPKPNPRPPGTPPGARIENTGQWYNPPLFYVTAAVIETATDKATHANADRAHKAVQLFNVLLALGVAWFAFLTARELFPRSRTAQLGTLAFVALAPVFVRTAVAYHGQMLATFMSTAALYVVTRALVRRQVTLKTGLGAGLLLALGMLTRHFVLATTVALAATLLAYWVFTRERGALRALGVLVLSVVVLTAPWYIHQQSRYGDAFAASAKAPDKPFFDRQPGAFYFGKPRTAVFTQPYRPKFDNRFPQVSYADWWGDYFLYYDVPSSLRGSYAATAAASQRRNGSVPALPSRYDSERVRQSYVGILPTLLMLAGVIGLLVVGLRRRAAQLLAAPFMIGAIALEAIWVYIGYPTSDGDIMRATYLLTALAPLALATGWLLSRIGERNRIAFRVLLGVLALVAVVDLNFVLLHHFVGRGG
jgi:4-amino-4-deoxy-L-arabinose transferase-like glycosyltransferase